MENKGPGKLAAEKSESRRFRCLTCKDTGRAPCNCVDKKRNCTARECRNGFIYGSQQEIIGYVPMTGNPIYRTVATRTRCPACNGSGKETCRLCDRDGMRTCPRCKGRNAK